MIIGFVLLSPDEWNAMCKANVIVTHHTCVYLSAGLMIYLCVHFTVNNIFFSKSSNKARNFIICITKWNVDNLMLNIYWEIQFYCGLAVDETYHLQMGTKCTTSPSTGNGKMESNAIMFLSAVIYPKQNSNRVIVRCFYYEITLDDKSPVMSW